MKPLVEELHHPPDPVDALDRLESLPLPVLLESSDRTHVAGRYSFLSADPFLLLEYRKGRVRTSRRSGAGPSDPQVGPLEAVADLLREHRSRCLPGLPPFQGGLMGILGYELGHVLERLPAPPPADFPMPDLHLGAYDWVVAWDHHSERAWIFSTGFPGTGSVQRKQRAARRIDQVRDLLGGGTGGGGVEGSGPALEVERDRVPERRAPETRPPRILHPAEGLPGFRSPFSRRDYVDAVERIRRYIRQGDVFQVNLSQRLEAPLAVDPEQGGGRALYRRVRECNPAPFAAYVETADAQVVSASPERFLLLRNGWVETRPIKGTAPRRPDPEEDRARLEELLASGKDRAENVMIVDLLRNDLSRVCREGTVQAPELCRPESHPTVHHLVSTVRGRLREGLGPVELLGAAFPGGSITGAPKIRAMEIIAELEPTRRWAYTGSVGYIGFDGTMDVSVAIRTFMLHGGTAYLPAGGGIVLDSDPEAEYRETLDKARGLAGALEPWVPAQGSGRP